MKRSKLKELRKKAGWKTQESIAKALNVSRSFYGKIELGTRKPRLDLAKRIATLVKANSIEEIFFEFQWDNMYQLDT